MAFTEEKTDLQLDCSTVSYAFYCLLNFYDYKTSQGESNAKARIIPLQEEPFPRSFTSEFL